jgi:hypothetical protein
VTCSVADSKVIPSWQTLPCAETANTIIGDIVSCKKCACGVITDGPMDQPAKREEAFVRMADMRSKREYLPKADSHGITEPFDSRPSEAA